MDTDVLDARPDHATSEDEARFSLRVLPFALHLCWQPRLVIDRADIAQVGSAIASSGRRGLPLLVEVTALEDVTREAREAIHAYEHPARIAILGYDAVDRMLAAFTVRTATDIRFFTGRDHAVRWLLQ